MTRVRGLVCLGLLRPEVDVRLIAYIVDRRCEVIYVKKKFNQEEEKPKRKRRKTHSQFKVRQSNIWYLG